MNFPVLQGKVDDAAFFQKGAIFAHGQNRQRAGFTEDSAELGIFRRTDKENGAPLQVVTCGKMLDENHTAVDAFSLNRIFQTIIEIILTKDTDDDRPRSRWPLHVFDKVA